jgi:hypothetical protein
MTDLPQVASGLAEQLRQYVNNGGNLLVFPAQSADLGSYRTFLQRFPADEIQAYEATPREVSAINTNEFIFRDVFRNRNANLRLPTTQGNFPIGRLGSRRQESLLTYRDGSTALGKYRIGKGNLYLNSAPLDNEINDLALNAEIFIPMLYKMGISSGRRRPAAYTIGQNEVIETNRRGASSELVYKLRGPAVNSSPDSALWSSACSSAWTTRYPKRGFMSWCWAKRS